jgi:hypothetical protein
MIDGTIRLDDGRTVALASYLDAALEEAARDAEYAWIKQLRLLPVDGVPFRQRFTVRGDSLWWFSEIYLHKQRAILDTFRTILAAESLIEHVRPRSLHVVEGSAIVRDLVPQVAAARGVETDGRVAEREWEARLSRLRLRARGLTFAAFASRLRPLRLAVRRPPPGGRIAAFVHRAFWRSGEEDGGAESYIGPVLQEIETHAGVDAIRYVGIGPTTNFRARRWWDPIAAGPGAMAIVPIERYAPWRALSTSRAVWRAAGRNLRLMEAGDALRDAARIRGVDCWPIVREELAGIAWLQWPWSVRAMDEAGAALDALRPKSVLTYAEAGGWGRALILEARRRGIPSAGLQHGFIYRRWLNYLHEPDEMQAHGEDRGFPVPTVTLAFDEYAARHLREHGRFAADALRITGSPRLDALMESLSGVSKETIRATRSRLAVPDAHALVLVTTKEREARHVLPALIAAAETLPNVTLIIKPHPAETADAYSSVTAGHASVRVVSASEPLAPLMSASRAIVTVNSTLALDAAVADIPALVVGLPNNLSPFVAAGALAGADTTVEIAGQLERILYHEGFRQQLAAARSVFLRANAMGSDGAAAMRSAAAVLELTGRP